MEYLLIKIILGGVGLNICIQWFFLKKLWNHEQRISLIEGKIIQRIQPMKNPGREEIEIDPDSPYNKEH